MKNTPSNYVSLNSFKIKKELLEIDYINYKITKINGKVLKTGGARY